MDFDRREAGLDCPGDDPVAESLAHQVGEDRDDVDAQGHEETVPAALTRM